MGAQLQRKMTSLEDLLHRKIVELGAEQRRTLMTDVLSLKNQLEAACAQANPRAGSSMKLPAHVPGRIATSSVTNRPPFMSEERSFLKQELWVRDVLDHAWDEAEHGSFMSASQHPEAVPE